MKTAVRILLALLCALLIPASAQAAATVTTGPAVNVVTTQAALTGTVNPNGVATDYDIQWGTDTTYGHGTTWTYAGAGSSAVSVQQTQTGLVAGTTYHYRIRAHDTVGSAHAVNGPDQTFTTPASAAVWTQIMDDEFNSGGVPTHWHLYNGPYGSNFENCAAPSQASVSGGYLHMMLSYRADLPACGGAGEPQTHWYSAGMSLDSSLAGHDQQVTMRWRVVSTDPVNVVSHRIMPMRFFVSGVWPTDGEEDWCEGSSLTGCAAYFHAQNGNCEYALPDCSADYPINESQWNTTKIERITSPTGAVSVNIYVNNMTTPLLSGQTTTLHMPDTLKTTILQQECRGSTGCPSSTLAGQDEDIEVDSIKVANRG